MKNFNPTYILRYFFDWGAGCCFWSANGAARARFGYSIAPEQLPLSESTIKRANELIEWHDQALNWEYPPDPGPWRQEECERFNQAAKDLFTSVRRELGNPFAVIDEFVEEKEDPELDAYLRDPKGFQRTTYLFFRRGSKAAVSSEKLEKLSSPIATFETVMACPVTQPDRRRGGQHYDFYLA